MNNQVTCGECKNSEKAPKGDYPLWVNCQICQFKSDYGNMVRDKPKHCKSFQSRKESV